METRDVVVIGGGIAGLAAAWRLRDRDVLLLEAEDRLGGRLRSEQRGDYWLNLGAHLFPAPGSLVDSMARDCALETVPVSGSMMGLAVGETKLTSGRVETYPLRLPLPLRDRVAFAKAGLKVQLAVRGRRSTPDEVSFGEFLGHLPPAAESIFSCAAHRATAELDELSAASGIGLFALVWGGKGSLIARNLLGGTGQLPAALGRALGDKVRTGCRVTALREEGTGLVVEHEGGRVGAKHVVMAAQAPHAAPIVRGVSPAAADLLAQFTYGAFLTVAVETNETRAMPWDDVYAMATPGRVFDMFTNQAHALRKLHGPRRPGGSLMLFAGARAAEALMREPDEVIAERFLADLHGLYPESRGVVAGTLVHRWELGNVYSRPGQGHLRPALAGALGTHANLHLAGDYFAELGNMEAAAQTGLAAAERIITQESHDPVPRRPSRADHPVHP